MRKGLDLILSQEKFAYNNYVNKTIEESPFHIVHRSSPRNSLELRKLDKGETSSSKADDFLKHMKNLHEEVRNHIIKRNTHYKANVDEKRRHKEF